MKGCKEVRNLLVAYSADELTGIELEKVREHLEICTSCLDEVQKIKGVFQGIEFLQSENMGVIEEIEWNARARQITASSISRSRRKKRSFFSGWRLMAPVLASVFVLGLMLGYLLFHSQGAPVEFPLEPETADLSFNRIESTLARKEVLHFLKQSQLLLTELMVRCDKDGLVFLDSKIKKDQINALLKKSRYLDHHLNDPQLMSSKNLLAEIELLLYEISALEKNISCRSIQNLQQSIHQQRLFFKIRLIEKELSLYEV